MIADKQREMSTEIRGVLDNLYAVLEQVRVQNQNKKNELNAPLQPEHLEHLQESEQSTAQMLLTPRQVEGIAQIQALCNQVGRICQQINTLNVVYELGLKPVHFFEIPNLLMQMDEKIQLSKMVAKRLGVKNEVLPKAKFAEPFINKVHAGSSQK